MQNLCGEVLTYLQNLHSSKKSGVCIIWGGNTLGWFVWPFLSYLLLLCDSWIYSAVCLHATVAVKCTAISVFAWLSLNFILYTSWVALSSVVCESVCQASVSPDQISTFSNIYRHTSPLLTMYHLISSSTNLYWPSTSQCRHILTQYHQVPLIIHHFMSHAQYTWSSFHLNS